MRIKDIVLGGTYRHRTSSIGYAKPVLILPPKTGENTNSYTVVKCIWATDPSFQFSLYKYFKPSDLQREAGTP